jgi:uncharacterized protein
LKRARRAPRFICMPHRLAVALAALVTMLPAASLAQAAGSSSSGDGTTAVITGQGVVSRPPDMATIGASIQSNDDVATNAQSKNNATLAALTSALAVLHIDAADVKTTYYNVTFNPRPAVTPSPAGALMQPPPYPYPGGPRYGYNAIRQLSIAISRVSDVGAVIDAALKAGVTSLNGVQYGLKDRAPANEAALAAALADAANQAKVVAAASHMRLGGIKQIQVGQSYGGSTPMPMRTISNVISTGTPTEIAPTGVEVRASVTVTYYLKP